MLEAEFGKEKGEALAGVCQLSTTTKWLLMQDLANECVFSIDLTDEEIEEKVRKLVLTPSS